MTNACIFIASAAPALLLAQGTDAEFVIRSWERGEGLPPTVINNVQRAANGYLWLATQRGLVQFDGERFKLLSTEVHPEFPTNWVNCVMVDSGGGVWMGTPAGLFHRPSGRHGSAKWSEIGSHLPVRALALAQTGGVWALSTSNDLIEVADRTPRTSSKISGDQPSHLLLRDNENGLLVASRSQAFMRRGGQWLPLSPELIANVRPDLACPSQQGGFWLAVDRGVARLAELDGEFKLTRPECSGDAPQAGITALMEDHGGRLWVGTRQGAVHCLEPAQTGEQAGWAWRQVTPKRLRSLGSVSCLYEDNEGLVWVGTTGGFLHQIKRRQVTLWSLPAINQESVPHTVCAARDGAVWIGTDGAGAYRFQDGAVSPFGLEQGLSNRTVIAILEDRQGSLWFGTFGGLFRLENGRFNPELESVVKGQPVPALFEDRAGNLWFGTSGAVVRKRGNEVSTFPLGSTVQDREVRAIAQGQRGELWIGTGGGGLFRLQKDKVERHNRFSAPRIQALHCDARGNLWVGTATRGLFRVAGNLIYNWARGDGLPSPWIHSILEDSSGTLWLGSTEGLFGVTKQALMARERSKDSPLLTIHVASPEVENWSAGSGQPCAAKGPDGRLWFPAGHGVLSFLPAELMRPRPELPVLIEEALVDGVERVFDETSPLRIYTGLKRLEFRYTIADLDSPGRLKFRYKLEGLDDRWVDAGAQRSATYGPLPPGNYRFRVISAGSANVWTETANPLSLRVVPHFWQTAWFQAGSAMLVLAGVGIAAHFIGRAKLRRKLERLELQQAMEKERGRIARDLHDDLGSGISEIRFLSELASQVENPSPDQICSQLNDITQKAQQMATAIDEIVWTVNPRNDSLPNLASYLCDYAREFLRAANVVCRIDRTESLPVVPLTAQQRHNLFMAVKEALNNAVKYSGANEVWLRISWTVPGTVLAVCVEDDGRGFDPALALRSDSGNGLVNMQTRLESIGGNTTFTSQPNQGTKVCFTLPLAAGTSARPSDSLN